MEVNVTHKIMQAYGCGSNKLYFRRRVFYINQQ